MLLKKENITLTTIGSVVVGVGIGRYVFKSKNLLFLSLIGVGTALAVNFYMKKKLQSKKASINDEKLAEEIKSEIQKEQEKSSFYGINERIYFENQLKGGNELNTEMIQDKPSNYMDLSI